MDWERKEIDPLRDRFGDLILSYYQRELNKTKIIINHNVNLFNKHHLKTKVTALRCLFIFYVKLSGISYRDLSELYQMKIVQLDKLSNKGKRLLINFNVLSLEEINHLKLHIKQMKRSSQPITKEMIDESEQTLQTLYNKINEVK